MSFGWMGLLTAGVLIFSDSKDIVNMDQISDKTQFFWDPSFSKQTLNDPSFVNKKVLLVVHGYNNTFDYAVKSIKEVNSFINNMKTSDNKPLYDLVIGYIWPGYESFIEYELAVEHADALKERVQAHLLELHHITPHIDVIAHSLGNRVILEALNFESVNKERPLIRNFFALAPAVDASSIEENRPYYNSVKNCENFFVFHSFKDDVLKLLYPLTSGSEALGIEINPNFKKLTPNIQFIDCTKEVAGHGYYFQTKAIYNFIEKRVHNQTPPPQKTHKVILKKNGNVIPIKN